MGNPKKGTEASDFFLKVSIVSVKFWFTFLSTNYVSKPQEEILAILDRTSRYLTQT